jgi:hypothetical protein
MATDPRRKQPEPDAESSAKKQERRKENPGNSELDAALEDTFPASDPVSVTQRVTPKPPPSKGE